MALINRPTKPTSGSTNFDAGDIIVAEEVNDDIIPLYDEINGNIENANIKIGAAIEGAKLALSGYITNTHINSTANINASKLLNASINTVKMAALSITSPKLAVDSVTIKKETYEATPTINLGMTTSPGTTAWLDIDDMEITGFVLDQAALMVGIFQTEQVLNVTEFDGFYRSSYRMEFDDGVSGAVTSPHYNGGVFQSTSDTPGWLGIDIANSSVNTLMFYGFSTLLPAATYAIMPQIQVQVQATWFLGPAAPTMSLGDPTAFTLFAFKV